ncbi:hypothetical protein H7J06_13925 [Mycobacterium hodleri]|uniref:hypothetical protein n=1 Tax=Mycolicibacterium hodleri TaxID=49897 RepID=UPI0021F36753|nr:hypothetical protein [Mycolicibacterium hodleri]MCV7134084.1 hypothetical protein [Mycolicibacterium hodleri]
MLGVSECSHLPIVKVAILAQGDDAAGDRSKVRVATPAKRLYERKGFHGVGQGNGPLGLALIKDLR